MRLHRRAAALAVLTTLCAAADAVHAGTIPLSAGLRSSGGISAQASATTGATRGPLPTLPGAPLVPTPGTSGSPWVTLPSPSPTPDPAAVQQNLGQAVAGFDPSSLPTLLPSLATGYLQRNLSALPPPNAPGLLEYLHENTSGAGSGLGVSDPSVAVPSPLGGRWSPTGSLNEARGSSSITTLKNGRVLMAGGFDGAGATATCELYDTSSGTWSPTGNLTFARGGQNAVLLSDGRVLVIGGYGTGPLPLQSAEIYDPATGAWSSVGNIAVGLAAGFAVGLSDGRVLVGGGVDNLGNSPATVEVIDFATGTVTMAGELHEARWSATATLLPDGSVLVAGGYDPNTGQALSSSEIYTPVRNKWTLGSPMPVARYGHTATLLTASSPDSLTGRRELLITGGTDGYNLLASTEVYDPATQVWERVGDLHQGRYDDTATALTDGRLLLTGGDAFTANTWTLLASTEIFDPVTGTWAIGASMATARAGQGTVQLPDGRVLAAGGAAANTGSTVDTASSELFTLPT